MIKRVEGSHRDHRTNKPQTVSSELKSLSDKVTEATSSMGTAPAQGIVGYAASSLQNRVTENPSVSPKEANIRPKRQK